MRQPETNVAALTVIRRRVGEACTCLFVAFMVACVLVWQTGEPFGGVTLLLLALVGVPLFHIWDITRRALKGTYADNPEDVLELVRTLQQQKKV